MSARARWRRRPERPLRRLTLIAAALAAMLPAVAERATEPVVAGVVLNGNLLSDALLIYQEADAAGPRFWLPDELATEWRLETSGRPHRDFGGIGFAAFCGALDKCSYDDSSALLMLDLPANELLSLRFTSTPVASALAEAGAPGRGAYMNYDVAAWHNGHPGASALVEGRVATGMGHGTLRLAGVAGAGRPSMGLAQAVWQVDLPSRGLSLQLGSIATPDTSFGAGLPLTGVRIGSNALLDPTRSQVLQPRVEGLAERALRADVFVDGMFRQTAQVPYGPYSVELTPHYPGRGDIELVSTDIAGRQLRVQLPYYQAPQMLTPGATEWSVDTGRPEMAVGQRGMERPWVTSATLRRGMSRSVTAQLQGVLARHANRLAMSADVVQPRYGLSSVSAIWQPRPTSGADTGRPQWWLALGHEYTARTLSASLKLEQSLDGGAPAGASTQTSTPASLYTAADSTVTERLARPVRHVAAQVGATLPRGWSVAAALDGQTASDGRRSSVAALNLRWQASARNQLALSLQRLSTDGRSGNALLLSWSQPLGRQYTSQIGLQRQRGRDPALLWSAQSLPASDIGGGEMLVSGSLGGASDIGVRWTQHAAQADWRTEARVDGQGLLAAMGASGSLGLLDGRFFASRRIGDAYVLVDAGVPGLPVLLDNREVARTNADGWAVVADARAHEPNVIGVDASALPVRYAMPQDQQTVVPGIAAGVVARFDVSDGGLAIVVRDARGQALPAGAAVHISSQRLPTAVTSRGEVFLERSDRAAQITIEWAGRRCSFGYRPQDPPPEGYRCLAA